MKEKDEHDNSYSCAQRPSASLDPWQRTNTPSKISPFRLRSVYDTDLNRHLGLYRLGMVDVLIDR